MRGSLVITFLETNIFQVHKLFKWIRKCLSLGVALAEEKTCSARINPIQCLLNRRCSKLIFMGGVVQVPRATPSNSYSLSYTKLLPSALLFQNHAGYTSRNVKSNFRFLLSPRIKELNWIISCDRSNFHQNNLRNRIWLQEWIAALVVGVHDV